MGVRQMVWCISYPYLMKTTTASPRQTFALFCATGKDWRSNNLTHEQASNMLSAIMPLRGNKPAALELATRIHSGEQVNLTDLPPAGPSFEDIYQEAHAAGHAAAMACNPVPMVVCAMSGNPIETISDGVCGFAWVNIKDGRKPFSKWLVKNGKADRDNYRGGVRVWVGDYRQSLDRKSAYAGAFSRVLNSHGIKSMAMSRMD